MSKPRKIVYHKRSRLLALDFDGNDVELPAELLRVYSPSAEVRGHDPSERKLQTGKKHVAITGIEPVGNYAIRLLFDDGHDSGLYAWEFLQDLAENAEQYWQGYLAELKSANASRLPVIPIGHWSPREDA